MRRLVGVDWLQKVADLQSDSQTKIGPNLFGRKPLGIGPDQNALSVRPEIPQSTQNLWPLVHEKRVGLKNVSQLKVTNKYKISV